MGNIVGIDLNVDNNYLNEAVKSIVMTGIAETLDKDKIVNGLVKAVLETKVDKEGRISSYSSDNRYTLLEVYVNNIIREIVKEEMKKLVEEKRTKMQEIIRRELNKRATLDKFVDAFISNNLDNLDSNWKTKISVEYEKDKEY
ncbi:putative uncharacterized protein [Clostridium sp. CAG:269]|jgi:hypothetical protein|nr:hypothetical protein [Clostridia bacterium]CDE54980.1 putative uncharacterized protein [Clostridium sp. CAG:269]DAJ56971.1 MAG TPA: hypothetical protein [Caudoviricetes sp.]DAN92110.1 MAG TPA: hypothetical protein [Caudoviricetes sp.]